MSQAEIITEPPSQIKLINPKQLNKLNQLEQSTNKIIIQPDYNLEFIFNKIKEIGRLVQLIRIERRGIIYGNDLWESILVYLNLYKNV